MRVKVASLSAPVVLPAAMVLAASLAQGQESPVTTAAKSAKVGLEFRTELNYNDHGLEKEEGKDPDATSDIEVQKVNVKLSGNIDEKTEYKFRFNLLDVGKSPLDYGYATHWLTDSLGIAFGKQKVLQGGWDNLDNSFRDHAQGVYAKNFAFAKYEDMISLQLKAAGKVQLQLLNDVVGDEAAYNKKEHPTFILGWQGDFSGIMPLVNLGTYDNQKSNWLDIGVKLALAGANVRADVSQHTMGYKGFDSSGEDKDVKDVATTFTLKASYEIKNLVTPSFYYSMYETKQDTEGYDPETGEKKEDVKVNSPEMKDDKPTGKYLWDDNGTTLSVSVDVNTFGKGWTPYLAYVANSGKFPKSDDATKEESKTETQIRLGVLGEF